MTDSTQNQPSGRYRVIDTHAHIVLEETFGAAGKFGPRLGVNQKNIPLKLQNKSRIRISTESM